jgi:hypothetical protein
MDMEVVAMCDLLLNYSSFAAAQWPFADRCFLMCRMPKFIEVTHEFVQRESLTFVKQIRQREFIVFER